MQIANYGEQPDGSIVDLNGNTMSAQTRIEICRSVEELPASEKSIIDAIKYYTKQGLDFIVDGSTGSGKSTTVGNIVRSVTGNSVIQTVPRVLAARGLGDRVSNILLAQTGDPQFTLGKGEIGFRTGAGNSGKKIDMLSINTDGTQLMRMLYSGLYPDTLIIDEVQSKSIATDVLLQLAREKKDMQIGIMSATLDPQFFQDFLKTRGKPVPIIEIPGKIFPIAEHYNRKEGSYDKIIELAKSGKHTLLMVSGKGEIEEWVTKLKTDLVGNYEIIGLHAELSENEQAYVVEPLVNHDVIRIIVATNVAEESITIPYLDAVVDLGRHKVGIVNPDGIGELRIEPTPQANMKQRRGRVGRTKPGEYHRYCNTDVEDLYEYSQAEIENSTLEHVILLYAHSGRDLKYLLGEANKKQEPFFLHKVDTNLMNIGYKRLERIGALDLTGNITELGEDILQLSIDPFLGRMIIESVKRGCIEEMITICAIFSVNGFLSKDGTWKNIKTGNRKKSDFLGYIDILRLCTQKKLTEDMMGKLVLYGVDRDEIQEFNEGDGSIELFKVVDLEPLGIKNHKILEIQNMIYKLQERLSSNGINVNKRKEIVSKNISENGDFDDIATCIVAGYPFYYFKYDQEQKRFIHEDHDGKRSREMFKQASISMVEVSKDKSYIGMPFILGPDEDNDIGFGEFDNESFFDGDKPVKQDFALLSHITEISDSYYKDIQSSQSSYDSIFKKKRKPIQAPVSRNRENMYDEYLIAISDMQKGFPHEKFLYYTLPLFLITQNHRFKKLQNQTPEYLEELYARLSSFLMHNKKDYAHRISDSFEDIEKSFISDNDIFTAFRTWEKHKIATLKKHTRQGKKIDKVSSDEIASKYKLFQAQKAYGETLGRLERGDFYDETKFDNKERKLLDDIMYYIEMQSTTFNRMDKLYREEVGGLNRVKRTRIIQQINSTRNQKSALTEYKTRIRDMNRFISILKRMKEYCDHPTIQNFIAIKDDLDFVEAFINSNEKNRKKELLSSKSQRMKLLKGVGAIKAHFIDKTGSRRRQREIQSFSRGLLTFISNYSQEVEKKVSALQEKEVELEQKRTNNIALRNELAYFFKYMYDEQYYIDKIEPLLNQIIVKILDSEDGIIQIIEKCVRITFDNTRLVRRLHTRNILDFYHKKSNFFKHVQEVTKVVGQMEKNGSKSVDDYTTATEDIDNGIKVLQDKKSLILSL